MERDDYRWLTFREIGAAAGAPSIREAIGRLDDAHAQAVARYLRSGVVCVEIDEESIDVVTPDRSPSDDLSLVSDGEWVWPRVLVWYVETYRCTLDAAFLESVRRNGVVTRSRVNVVDVCRWYTAAS